MKLKSLFARNVALLFGIILASQFIFAASVATFILRPQTQRATHIVADMMSNLSLALGEVPPDRRAGLIREFSRRQALVILPTSMQPESSGPRPGLLERYYMRTLVNRLERQREIAWRTDASGRLWLHLDLGGEYYWVSLSNPRVGPPLATLGTVLLMTVLLALTAGYLLQRWLSAPLARFAAAADRFGNQPDHDTLHEGGPTEIARVAQSFNAMAERLNANERERTVMLAGISHDLRTPLAKLALALEMLDCDDQDLHASAQRQVRLIDEMLGQFFEFARGFEQEPLVDRDLEDILHQAFEMAGGAQGVAWTAPSSVMVRVRPVALSRAIANLIVNARRHGKAPVEARLGRQGGNVLIEVSDAGPGFDPVQDASLLTPFARGESARSGDGSGLGLAIAQRAAASMKGRLRFQRVGNRFCAQILLPQ